MNEPPTINENDRLQPYSPAQNYHQAAVLSTGGQPSNAIKQSAGAGNQISASDSLLDNRWFILGVIFLAMMFLGLPLLWRSRSFSLIEKAIWTVVVLVYSAVVIWLFVVVMKWSIQQFSQAFQ